MVLCSSCKNKTSTDRCNNQALTGVIFCGKHVKCKNPRIWVTINNIENKVNLISKIWKGYKIRKLLNLAGPGVLNRSKCINEDEIILLEPITKVHPLDYFGFEENGKLYGFDIRTLFDVLNRTCANPFTRQPITIDVRKRIRSIYGYRLRNKLSIFYEQNLMQTKEFILRSRWMQIMQIMEENEFFQINPNICMALNKSQLYVIMTMIRNDVRNLANEHKSKDSERYRFLRYLDTITTKYLIVETSEDYSFFVTNILLTILYYSPMPYNYCFIIMSAFYRL